MQENKAQLDPVTVSKVDSYLLDIERIAPEIQQIIDNDFRGLSEKQRRTIVQIKRMIDETQVLRGEYHQVLAAKNKGQKGATGANEKLGLGGTLDDSKLSPPARLQQLRRNIENASYSKVPGVLIERLKNWDYEVKETCGRLLLDDIDGAIKDVERQNIQWQKQLSQAKFGSPGILGRLFALRFHFRYRTLKTDLASAKMKLNSCLKVLEKKMERCESLAGAALGIFRLFGLFSKPVASYSSVTRRFERIMRLQIEHEITHGIRRRGSSLSQALEREEYARKQKAKFCAEALQFISSRKNMLSDLQKRYVSENPNFRNQTIETAILNSFVASTYEFNKELALLKSRAESLAQEFDFQRMALLSRIERIARYVPYEPKVIEEIIQRKAADNDAFVIPSKETLNRS